MPRFTRFLFGFYPPVYVGLILLARAHIRDLETSMWLDGAIGALAIAAVGAALIFDPILASTGGATAEVATDLAYPLADFLVLAVVVAVLAITGWRPGRTWAMIAASFIVGGVADAIHLYENAKGIYVEGTLLDTLWPASTLLLAYAAWARCDPPAPSSSAASACSRCPRASRWRRSGCSSTGPCITSAAWPWPLPRRRSLPSWRAWRCPSPRTSTC